MNGKEFIKRAKRYAKKTGQECRFLAAHGKGSHGRLYLGEAFTTVQHGEIATGTFNAMLKVLKIKKEKF